MRKVVKSLLITLMVLLFILILYRQQHQIKNVFDEIYYMDNRIIGRGNYDYIDDLGYKCRKFRDPGFPGAYGYKDVTWFISETSDGREYIIENGLYRIDAMSLNVRISNESDLEIKYEYLYHTRGKAYRRNTYIYYLQNNGRDKTEIENEVQRLTAEAEDILDHFLNEYITYNKGKTKFHTDDWGKYDIWPGKTYKYK